MRFISLIDTTTQNIITIDLDKLVLRLEIDSHPREIRLKSYYGEILYALFSKQPVALSYDEITMIFKKHKLVITDFTRMHRKLSEIRNFLANFHTSLSALILNIRGIGYSLPLRLKNLNNLENNHAIKFQNSKIAESILAIKGLIDDAIYITSNNKVILHTQGYVINRDPIRSILIEKISAFNNYELIILEQIRAHEADIIYLRAQYLLAKLKTYIGLARISDYPISDGQWLEWFKLEVSLLFDDLRKLLKLAELS